VGVSASQVTVASLVKVSAIFVFLCNTVIYTLFAKCTVNALVGMRVLKASLICTLAIKKPFNTLPFFAPQEEFHPIGRPFVPVSSVAQDLVSCKHSED
jgi:hypothetical protein